MADLEKTIDTPENSGGSAVSNTWNDFNLDFSDSLTPDSNPLTQENAQPEIPQSETEPTLSNVTPENSVENNLEAPLNSFPEENINEASAEDTIVQESLEVSSGNTDTNVTQNSLSNEQPSLQPEETPTQQDSNNVFLWSFENDMNNPTNNEEVHNNTDNSALLDQPAILDNPFSNSNAKEQEEKNKLIQKEKLAHLIKAHESKAQKSWFIKWILSGVIAMIAIIFVSFLFAKDQVIDVINMINDKTPWLSANVVDITDPQNEEVDENNENIIDNEIENENIDNEDEYSNDDEIENSEYENSEYEKSELDEEEYKEIIEKFSYQIREVMESNIENNEKLAMLEDIHKEILSIDPENEELVKYIDESTMKIYEEIAQEEVDENIEEENSDNSNEEEYSIIHVDSEEEANWVLPSHCTDLSCYGEDKEFTPCTTFRLSENLDENANRIGKNWVCKYKDPSELVYVELN